MAKRQLLDDEAGLDGFAEADVIGHQQVDTRHLDGTNQWIKLVVLDFHTAAEWGLQ